MNIPDYNKYSIDELYEALNTINENEHPDQKDLIETEIQKRKLSSSAPQKLKNSNAIKFNKYEYHKYINKMQDVALVLYIISLVFGLSFIIAYFTGIQLHIFSYKLGMSFPGFLSLSAETRVAIYTVIVVLIHISFIAGSIGSYFKLNLARMLLVVTWGIMSVGFELWIFRWWPSLNFDLPFSVTFDLQNIALGFKVNFVSLFFFIWSIIISPEIRRDFFSE